MQDPIAQFVGQSESSTVSIWFQWNDDYKKWPYVFTKYATETESHRRNHWDNWQSTWSHHTNNSQRLGTALDEEGRLPVRLVAFSRALAGILRREHPALQLNENGAKDVAIEVVDSRFTSFYIAQSKAETRSM